MKPLTIALLWLAVGGIAAYWATFFTNLPGAAWDRCFIVFERAFPVADAALAGSAALTAEMLRRSRPAAVMWGLFAAGQFCFLGLLGASYNLQNGGYNLTPAMLAELFVNVFCLAMAAWLNTFLWRQRIALGA
jgi:hypothetical protein